MGIGAGASVLACGMVAGLFLTFSDFVMRALRRADPAAGVQAMQLINREIFRSVTILMLWGVLPLTGVTSAALAMAGRWEAAAWLAAAAGLHAVGVIGVSFARNIPLNEKLDALPHKDAEAAAFWPVYVARWTPWNSLRAVASAVASLSALAGLLAILG